MNHPADIFTPHTHALTWHFQPICINCPTLCNG